MRVPSKTAGVPAAPRSESSGGTGGTGSAAPRASASAGPGAVLARRGSGSAGRGAVLARRARRLAASTPGALRRNWLMTGLLLAGLALRILAQVGYRPALFYLDTTRYLDNSGGSDPVGYRVPLRLILLAGHSLGAVTAVQHLLGLAMAVAIYLVLTRRGVPRWLAALAAAPVLLDAYQLQMEQTIMPDVWFQALILAGLALLLWRGATPLPLVAAAGLALGVAVTFRQVGEILVVPALVYLVVALVSARRGAARTLVSVGTLTGAFAVPILAYLTISAAVTGHFWLSDAGTNALYGRMAAAADCAALRVPANQRAMCPSAAQRAALGADGLEHSQHSPVRRYYADLPHAAASATVSSFTRAVATQQPLRVLGAIGGDTLKIFALTRDTRPGDTPISRWQFQDQYPFYPQHATRAQVGAAIAANGGGGPAVTAPVAAFLRAYQLGGGYTPGPLYAAAALAGLAGSLSLIRRRVRPAGPAYVAVHVAVHVAVPGAAVGPAAVPPGDTPAWRAPAEACLLFFLAAVAVLLTADVFEFSWRYQLPALVTLVPAGALGLTAAGGRLTGGRLTGGRHGELGRAGGVTLAGETAAAVLLAPLLLVQARRAIRQTPRLPGASGPPHGVAGSGEPRRRLLVIGESTAAGVGADWHARALPGFLAADLAAGLGGRVAWTTLGKSGATALQVLAELVPEVAGRPFDVVVLAIGINDLFNRRRLRAWAADLAGLIGALSPPGGRTRLVLSGMPPVHRVPAVPQPLRFLLGRRARAMNRVTSRVCAAHGALCVPLGDFAGPGAALFAPDGFHPSEAGYRLWARALATAIQG